MVPVKKGWLALEISTRASGYSLPSDHSTVSLVAMVERVKNEVPADWS